MKYKRKEIDLNNNNFEKYISENKSCRDIAITYNVSSATICRRAKELNIKLKRKNYKLGKKHHLWQGGIHKSKRGYVFLKIDHPNSNINGYVQEHVYIMSNKLGRKIEKNEIIHHINGDKSDNRLENLILLNNIQHCSAHQSLTTNCLETLMLKNIIVFNKNTLKYEVNLC